METCKETIIKRPVWASKKKKNIKIIKAVT